MPYQGYNQNSGVDPPMIGLGLESELKCALALESPLSQYLGRRGCRKEENN